MSVAGARDRRIASLSAKVSSLDQELQYWLGQADVPQLAAHRSQILDVCAGLGRMHSELLESTQAAERSRPSTEQLGALERKILLVIQIWECYRGKFSLRLAEPLRKSLLPLDDFAWEAYRPARERALRNGTVTLLNSAAGPPLVFPTPKWSPFARSREQAHELDPATGDFAVLSELERHLRRIPVPLIGVPWYQLSHLPDVILVGHEVGHLVEEDFQLEEPLREAIEAGLAAAQKEHRDAWSLHWRSEVFADIYGVLVGGPAFVRTLLDLLSGAGVAEEVRPTGRGWGDYPTAALRALLLCECLRQLPRGNLQGGEFAAAAESLKADWASGFPDHKMKTYEADIEPVVHAILTTCLDAFSPQNGAPGVPITEVMTFDGATHNLAEREGKRSLERYALSSKDARILVAAAALAFHDDHHKFTASNSQERFSSHMAAVRINRPRAASDFLQLASEQRRKRSDAIGDALSASFEPGPELQP